MTELSEPFPRTARDGLGRLVLRRHADVVAAAHDPATFSSAVSRYLQVPNGLDGAEHAAFRRLLDPFFAPERMSALAPALERTAHGVVAALGVGTFDAVSVLGARFAVRAQSVWLGWPTDLEDELLAWVEDNRAASRSGDVARTTKVAERFDAIIRSLLAARRDDGVPVDVTTELMGLKTEDGRGLTDAELVSILRNWTGGDLSSLALCTGVVVHWLATHPAHQPALAVADDESLDAAIVEMLRLDDPFVSNRRIATSDTTAGGCPVAAGDRLVLDWRAANRDPDAFADADSYDPDGHAAANLVYGTGPHVCPGRPLATLELRILVRTLLAAGRVTLDDSHRPVREEAPAAGFRSVSVTLA
ncbi:cytochrome P450 [Mumia zhuanghuii]|uniref:Cytochrome P450 n=2 Tax=Mumia TaxID=1546255 RepID=A0ABW1QGQ2_9ACTN|nr:MULTISPECIES: cytochrome P450 [Mumia]KAA1424793.1 cytochrome P450 [Mumia zhuanghuii]